MSSKISSKTSSNPLYLMDKDIRDILRALLDLRELSPFNQNLYTQYRFYLEDQLEIILKEHASLRKKDNG